MNKTGFSFLLICSLVLIMTGCTTVNQPAPITTPLSPTLGSIQLTPEAASVVIGGTHQFYAAGITVAALSDTIGISPTWEVTGSIGSIDNSGLFTAGQLGSGEIVARVGTMEDRASVTVFAPPDAVPPAKPMGIGAIAGNNSVALSWTANTDPDLTGYKIFRRLDGESSYSLINSVGSITSYSDNSVPRSSGTHYYKIRAVDSSGNESEYSDEVSASPTIMIDPIPVTIDNITNHSAQIRWYAAANATSYLVSYGADVNATNLGTITTSEVACELLGLNPDTNYYVKVKGQSVLYPALERSPQMFTTLMPNNVTITLLQADGVPVTSGSTITQKFVQIQGTVSVEAGRTVSSITMSCGDQSYLIKENIANNIVNFTAYVDLMQGNNTIIIRNTDSTGKNYESEPITLDANIPLNDIKIQLTWNNDRDADLQLIAPDSIANGNNTCYFAQRNPDWGVSGEATDNPKLENDITTGYGAEWISFQSPVDAQYTVKTRNFSMTYPVTLKVKVFVRDVLTKTYTYTFNDGLAGTYWTPCTITKSGASISIADVGTVGSMGVRMMGIESKE